jgi:hypothetical protein
VELNSNRMDRINRIGKEIYRDGENTRDSFLL